MFFRPSNITAEALLELQTILNYSFKDVNLLSQALTRQSAINSGVSATQKSFQRLEFLGDRVLDMVVSNLLFAYHPNWKVGELTTHLTMAVNNSQLGKIGQSWQLGKYLIIDNNEKNNNIQKNSKALADAVEAIVGAIYIDCGRDYKTIKSFIDNHWKLSNTQSFNIGLTSSQSNVASSRLVSKPAELTATHLQVQTLVGYKFHDLELLREALTRETAIGERIPLAAKKSSQILEFLGDRVVELCLADFLFEIHSDSAEGFLSHQLVSQVSPERLSEIGLTWQVGQSLIAGNGEIKNRIFENRTALTSAVKALSAAIFLDSGCDIPFLKNFIAQHWQVAEKLQTNNRIGK